VSGREQVDVDVRAAFAELFGAERRLRMRKPEREGGLSYGQGRALFLLGDVEQATAGEIARAADLTPASVTALVDHLERDGLVERRRSEHDRRSVVITLTPSGRAELEQLRGHWQARWAEALADLGDDELQAAATVMRRVAQVLDTLGT
jgi:DNA-binding MarR family transcriptional regulator